MKKIPTLFKRDPETNLKYVTSEVNPGCEWVLAGEGTPTRKFDGTCCLIRNGVLLKRREFKDGKPAPAHFEEEDYDPITGKHFGWVPVDPDDKGDRWYWEALTESLSDGTYELCGPKVQGNPEGFDKHVLVAHGREEILDLPRDYDGLQAWLAESNFEGIVWHHPDGRMVKLKRRDFPRHPDGSKRPPGLSPEERKKRADQRDRGVLNAGPGSPQWAAECKEFGCHEGAAE